MNKLQAHLMTLPRWAFTPAAIVPVVFGGVLMKAQITPMILAAISSCLVMAACHSMNTLFDYSITGFDKGSEEERSKPKPYTSGQSVIAMGILSEQEVLTNIIFWVGLSVIPTTILAVTQSSWVWLFWALAIVCSPLYSWGKKHYTCEFFLGLGFGPIAVCLGASAVQHPDFKNAFLAGLPFALLFGYAAEIADQWLDAEPNIPKGLKNIGALLYRKDPRDRYLAPVLGLFFSLAYICQLGLVLSNVLERETFLSLAALPLFFLCLSIISYELGVTQCTSRSSLGKVGIFMGLGGIFVYMVLLLIGQIVGG